MHDTNFLLLLRSLLWNLLSLKPPSNSWLECRDCTKFVLKETGKVFCLFSRFFNFSWTAFNILLKASQGLNQRRWSSLIDSILDGQNKSSNLLHFGEHRGTPNGTEFLVLLQTSLQQLRWNGWNLPRHLRGREGEARFEERERLQPGDQMQTLLSWELDGRRRRITRFVG